MAIDYSEIARSVHEALLDAGALLKLTTSISTYNKDTSTTSVRPRTISGIGVRTQFDIGEIDGTRIGANDLKFIVSPLQADAVTAFPKPKPGDRLEFAGSKYTVGDLITAWNYAGIDVGFIVQAKT